jgi:uncharacterized membrane protein
MNIKWTSYASDIQLRFWRWIVSMSEVAMNHRPLVQRGIYIGLVILAGLLAFTFGRLVGEFVASWFV